MSTTNYNHQSSKQGEPFAARLSFAVNATRALGSFSARAYPQNLREALSFLVAPDVAGYAPLHHAAATGNNQLLESLLAVLVHVQPAVVDVRDKNGRTALQWAVLRGHGQAIQSLVNAGASLVREDNDGRCALQHAIVTAATAAGQREFYHNMVRYFIQSGADVARRDSAGATALHLAAESGDVEMMGILVELGGSGVNVLDDDGETALFYAVRGGQIDAAKKLVDYGVDLQSANSSQETIADYCEALGDEKARSFLDSVLRPQGFHNVAAEKGLNASANLFGSNAFQPVFTGNSAFVNR
jgi:ankyrin repeat protein